MRPGDRPCEKSKRFFGYLQHPTEVLPQLIEAINGGCDLAIASRYTGRGGVSNWSLIRRAISRTAQLIGLVILLEVLGPGQRSGERLLPDSRGRHRWAPPGSAGTQDPD